MLKNIKSNYALCTQTFSFKTFSQHFSARFFPFPSIRFRFQYTMFQDNQEWGKQTLYPLQNTDCPHLKTTLYRIYLPNQTIRDFT